MEFLKVLVPGHEEEDIDVLLNRKKNGKVNEVLIVGRGYVRVSVDIKGAVEQRVNVTRTRAAEPLEVKINVKDKS